MHDDGRKERMQTKASMCPEKLWAVSNQAPTKIMYTQTHAHHTPRVLHAFKIFKVPKNSVAVEVPSITNDIH